MTVDTTIYRQKMPDGSIQSLTCCTRAPMECCCYRHELIPECEVDYREGRLPARYPVPALRHYVVIYADAVWFCEEPNKLKVLASR